ncbi:Hypothetical predicted protein, partial [Marmota monax]
FRIGTSAVVRLLGLVPQGLRTHSARTPLPAECAKLEAKGQRSPRNAQVGVAPSLLLLLLSELVPERTAESPWGLPVIADGPASLAKVVMAELSSLKFEEKTWPG